MRKRTSTTQIEDEFQEWYASTNRLQASLTQSVQDIPVFTILHHLYKKVEENERRFTKKEKEFVLTEINKLYNKFKESCL